MIRPFAESDIPQVVAMNGSLFPGSSSLAGPQDLTVADMSADLSRKLWERIGGSTALLYSLHWVKALKPFTYLLSQIRKGTSGRLFAIGAKPFAAAFDSAANSILNAAPPAM